MTKLGSRESTLVLDNFPGVIDERRRVIGETKEAAVNTLLKRYASTVYLIRAMGTYFYKVGLTKGFATDVKARLSALQTGNPHSLEVVGLVHVPSPAWEKRIHAHLRGFEAPARNEWFELRPVVIRSVSAWFTVEGFAKLREELKEPWLLPCGV